MISEQKKYIIEIFLKKCTFQNVVKDHIEFIFNLLKNTYSVSKEKEEKLRLEYNFDKYIERIIPIIDKYFTVEELNEAIKFFSSKTGMKMKDNIFLSEINKINSTMDKEIEQKFGLKNDNEI